MKSIEEVKKILQENKDYIRERYGVVIIGIFGSFARGEQTEVSDVDILVELKRPLGFEYLDLWDELETLLNCKVDLLTIGAAKQKPLLWQSIEEDLTYV
ncbi:MAG: nucleotidyltransferase family protein [Caldimicrobium sp.]|nr:nucleotidyltransferase family protein [Caldimicrobium sp.]MDW7973235.1 nucleotidyltransferase family protein [Thermodesulfovibrio sp.]